MTNLSQLYQSNLYNNFIPNIGFDEIKTNMDFEESSGNWRPIYEKLVDLGSLPNNTNKNVAHGISNLSKIVCIFGMADNGSGYNVILPTLANSSLGNMLLIEVTSTNVSAMTSGNWSSYSGYVTLKYTKTTDVATSSPRNPLGRPNERILGFFGRLTSDQTGLSDNTEYDVNLTAEVDPESGWSDANDEYVVPSEYDGMKCFVTAGLEVNDCASGSKIILYVYIDTGSGYAKATLSSEVASISQEWIRTRMGTEYIGTVSTGDKIKLVGLCVDFDSDTTFISDSAINRTFMQLEFQP